MACRKKKIPHFNHFLFYSKENLFKKQTSFLCFRCAVPCSSTLSFPCVCLLPALNSLHLFSPSSYKSFCRTIHDHCLSHVFAFLQLVLWDDDKSGYGCSQLDTSLVCKTEKITALSYSLGTLFWSYVHNVSNSFFLMSLKWLYILCTRDPGYPKLTGNSILK